jgi:RNA polymerase sigma-70 factor (ECF subfamily)
MTDEELLAAWRAGDAKAGEELALRHYESVRRFFDARLAEVAEDLTQRTFLACVEGVADGRLDRGFVPYLFGVARNISLMHLRSGYQRAHAALRAPAEPQPTSLTGVLARCQEQHFVLRAFAELPDDLQITVQLYYWEGLPTADIAAITEVTPSTVTTRLARARDRMRETIESLRLQPRLAASVVDNLEGWTRSLVAPRAASGPRR